MNHWFLILELCFAVKLAAAGVFIQGQLITVMRLLRKEQFLCHLPYRSSHQRYVRKVTERFVRYCCHVCFKCCLTLHRKICEILFPCLFQVLSDPAWASHTPRDQVREACNSIPALLSKRLWETLITGKQLPSNVHNIYTFLRDEPSCFSGINYQDRFWGAYMTYSRKRTAEDAVPSSDCILRRVRVRFNPHIQSKVLQSYYDDAKLLVQ